MRPLYHGQARCLELVTAFAEPVVAGPADDVRTPDVDLLITRAIEGYSRQHRPFESTDMANVRKFIWEEIVDADERGCIPNGSGATAFIVFAFAYGACLMKSGQLNFNGMKGIMASVDEYLCAVWRQTGIEMAPSTRPPSYYSGQRRIT